MQKKNNHASGIDLSLFKTIPALLKVESANLHYHANAYMSPIVQREHICIFTEAYCVSLGFL